LKKTNLKNLKKKYHKIMFKVVFCLGCNSQKVSLLV